VVLPLCHDRARAAKKQIPSTHCFWQLRCNIWYRETRWSSIRKALMQNSPTKQGIGSSFSEATCNYLLIRQSKYLWLSPRYLAQHRTAPVWLKDIWFVCDSITQKQTLRPTISRKLLIDSVTLFKFNNTKYGQNMMYDKMVQTPCISLTCQSMQPCLMSCSLNISVANRRSTWASRCSKGYTFECCNSILVSTKMLDA
jgi:hypothetical protein